MAQRPVTLTDIIAGHVSLEHWMSRLTLPLTLLHLWIVWV